VSSLGRILHVPNFHSLYSIEIEKAGFKEIRIAKKNSDAEGLRTAQCQLIKSYQKFFEGFILRRRTDSRDWKGNPLIDLPKCTDIVGVVKLTERENKILQAAAAAAKAK
jgi:hypothetical protein